jgi:hypothetical protein
MKHPIQIGSKLYKSKKEAISYYRTILNSYDFGQSLNDFDFADLIDLLNIGTIIPDTENKNEDSEEDEICYVTDIRVSKVQYNTKCFEVFYEDGTSRYISYLLHVNGNHFTASELFNIACRSAVSADIHAVKSRYFKGAINRMVQCQETGILSKWEELVIDHRQPNTFSVIVDRFKELHQIEPERLEYSTDERNNTIFVDVSIAEKFRAYHRAKANLRIVRRECNSGRNSMARLKRSNRDLSI